MRRDWFALAGVFVLLATPVVVLTITWWMWTR